MEVTYKFVTIAELKDIIDPDKPVMFDTETIGFYGRIRIAQFYQEHMEGCAHIVEWPNAVELAALLSQLHIVAHSVHYDISTIQYNLNHVAWQPAKYDCTHMLGRLHFYKQEKFDLENIITYTLGTSPYGMNKKDMQQSNWDVPVLSEDQKEYAALDVVAMQDVWNTVEYMREDINYKLDMLCIKYCLDFQNNGMPLDMDKLTVKYQENSDEIEKIGLPINCNSYKQVREYISSNLSDDHGLAVLIAQGNERAEDVRKTRKLTKENSFMTKWVRNVREGCIFGLFKPSARSGRTTSNDENLQQIPRKLKGLFGVPENGDEVMLISDFAQIQLRAVTVIAPDKKMEKLFRDGADLHNYVAEMIFGKDFTTEDRQIAKTSNFSLLFGAGIAVFKAQLLKDAGLWLDDAKAAQIKNKWLNLFTGIKSWQQRGIKDWKKNIAWETPLGRRYTARMMTDQLAMQIQGFEAEVAKLAMHYMLPKLYELSPNIKFRDFIHDGYIFTAPNDKDIYEAACKIIGDAMVDAWKEMSQSVEIDDLPMPTKVRVGWNWGEIEKAKKLGEGYFYEYSTQ